MADDAAQIEESSSGLKLRLGAAVVCAAALASFVLQNTQDVPVEFLWLDGSPPLYLLLLITVALTIVVSTIVLWLLRRRS